MVCVVVKNAHFFETSSTLITLVVVGKLMETVTKGKTSQALTELMSLQVLVDEPSLLPRVHT